MKESDLVVSSPAAPLVTTVPHTKRDKFKALTVVVKNEVVRFTKSKVFKGFVEGSVFISLPLIPVWIIHSCNVITEATLVLRAILYGIIWFGGFWVTLIGSDAVLKAYRRNKPKLSRWYQNKCEEYQRELNK